MCLRLLRLYGRGLNTAIPLLIIGFIAPTKLFGPEGKSVPANQRTALRAQSKAQRLRHAPVFSEAEAAGDGAFPS